MELTAVEEQAVKAIYTDYHNGTTNADEALHALEQLINGGLLPCDKCGEKIEADTHAEELGMCVECSNAFFTHKDEAN
jgi:Zn finger protein HypA/HybF involved in hydrogenase expression